MPPATLFRPLPTTRTRRRNRLTTRVGLGCQPDGGRHRALDLDRVIQAVSTQAWLELPFEQVQQQDGQPADQLSLLAFAPCSRSSAMFSISALDNLPARRRKACSFAQ